MFFVLHGWISWLSCRDGVLLQLKEDCSSGLSLGLLTNSLFFRIYVIHS